jgi:hypothetical protein
MLPTKFRFIWPNGFRGEESNFFNSFLFFTDFFHLYDPLSDLWLLTLIAYEKWLLSLQKIDFLIL